MSGTVCYLLFDSKSRHNPFLPEVFKLSTVDQPELLFIGEHHQPLTKNKCFPIFLSFHQIWMDVQPLPPKQSLMQTVHFGREIILKNMTGYYVLATNISAQIFECLSLSKLTALFSVCTLLFSAPLPQNNTRFVSLRLAVPKMWAFLLA